VIAPKAEKFLLLDIAHPDMNTFVTVGERGHILVSKDKGHSWKQAKVPTRSMLTAVFFANSTHGWAVGHDAVIVHTQDGGESWTRQFFAPEKEQPFFDVWFKDAQFGIAVGAYGLFMITKDGGKQWQEQDYEILENPEFGRAHLYCIVEGPDHKLFLCGESGFLARSNDYSETWEALERPYIGTFFNLLVTQQGNLIAMGLRGNIYRSVDQGGTWEKIPVDVTSNINSGFQREDGTIFLSGMTGIFLRSQDEGKQFQIFKRPDRIGISSVISIDNQSLLLVGEGGIHHVNSDGMNIK
ncbi:MAG: hypothetical protein HQK77_11780, partial [Desulfobacterales bacterium]|nr:hypothetical protein [Desulfobacterales bacterium]